MTDEDWQEPGNKLRAAREAKGLSLPDVAHRIRIPRTVIEALENDDYASFPSPTYAKSFLIQYAEFVDVDASKWLDYFEPVPFTGTDDVFGIVDTNGASESRQVAHAAYAPRRSNSIMPVIMLMLVTGGSVYGIVRGLVYLEDRFGDKNPPKQEAVAETAKTAEKPVKSFPKGAPPAPALKAIPVPAGEAEATSGDIKDVAAKPIPRAIIVD